MVWQCGWSSAFEGQAISVGRASVGGTDILARGEQLSVYFRLLPYVQSTRRIVCRSLIRRELEAYFATVRRGSFRQLQQALHKFDPGHVTAVAAAMVHEGVLQLEHVTGLTPDSILEVCHAPS